MKYFSDFPTISYTLTESGQNTTSVLTRTVPNMTAKLKMEIFNPPEIAFSEYRIKDKDRPDTIAAYFYGSSRYAWVIMLANNMRDWYNWPLSDAEFDAYMSKKYESSPNQNDGVLISEATVYQYLWVKDDGQYLVIDKTTYDTLSPGERYVITVYDKEYLDNDRLRTIRIPSVEQLPNIINKFNALMHI